MSRLAVSRLALVCLVAPLLSLTGGLASPAVALDAPSSLTPRGSTGVPEIPTLGWSRVPGAASYDVQVSTAPDFTPLLWSLSSTVNDLATPTAHIPEGDVWWRVRAKDASGLGQWSVATFRREAIEAPVLTAPDDGAELQQPSSPPLLRWDPVSGVVDYTIEISTDQNFTDPALISTHTTKGTSFIVPDLKLPTTYYWRVRGQLSAGFVTRWADPRSYRIIGLQPALVQAPNDSINQSVQDVVLDWMPVHGAATYELQVSTDINFLTLVDSRTAITGTRYSPPKTLNNDQYYWRVRPVDASNNKVDWTQVPTWRFRRNWPHQPTLEYPLNGATVGDPFYYQWSPVKHASSYTLQVSPNQTFSPASSVQSCTTIHTTFTPTDGIRSYSDCWPAAAGTYYWRVVARDDFASPAPVTDLISAQTGSFTYLPETVRLTSPSNAADVSLPVLSWEPLARAAKYKVTITSVTTGATTTATTAATSFTPRNLLTVDSTYRWQVQSIAEDGRLGAGIVPGDQRTFTVVAPPTPTASSPEPTSPEGTVQRFPNLQWTPVSGADRYRLLVRKAGTIGFTTLTPIFFYPAGEDDATTYLPAGDYEWYVMAYNGQALVSQSSSLGRFTIVSPDAVTGFRAAITGNALTGGAGTPLDRCAATLPAECANLRQTPVLAWDADPNVGYYKLYISRDSELTNLVPGFPTRVNSNIWSGTVSLEDSQAGSAYFWQVVPCTAADVCAPLTHADHAFNKRSVPVGLLSPANDAVVSNDVTLTWADFLDTEQSAPVTAETALATPARTEAQRYRVQTATDPGFQTVIETIEVDQTTFTSFLDTYPEGPIYWRVQAIDGSQKPLSWSETGNFLKQSPAPVPTSPAAGSSVSGVEPLTWSSLDFAASYELEVFKSDEVPTIANRVLLATTKQVAYSMSTPLPVSQDPYTWRVRRVDAKGRKGAWSALTSFTVTGSTPTLEGPFEDELVAPADAHFTWEKDPLAASYRFERSAPGGTIAETQNTPALAWAPRLAIPGGDWQWRVTSLDASGKSLGSSGWRSFRVIDTPAADTPVSISGSGQVGTVLTVHPPTWNLAGVQTTYQWLQNNVVIPGATGEAYEVPAAYEGRSITARATGTKPGYKTGTSTSNAIVASKGVPLVATEAPSITGSAAVGSDAHRRPWLMAWEPQLQVPVAAQRRPYPGCNIQQLPNPDRGRWTRHDCAGDGDNLRISAWRCEERDGHGRQVGLPDRGQPAQTSCHALHQPQGQCDSHGAWSAWPDRHREGPCRTQGREDGET